MGGEAPSYHAVARSYESRPKRKSAFVGGSCKKCNHPVHCGTRCPISLCHELAAHFVACSGELPLEDAVAPGGLPPLVVIVAGKRSLADTAAALGELTRRRLYCFHC